MPLYAYNIFTIIYLYLVIFYLNIYKDISIKARLFLPIIKALLSLSIPLSNLVKGF
ncbi:uncharacterized protein FFE2_09511 [Fusarium fujikuroi]|nr:uncharacterized protein FFE2_09511 [Fusarium fujikuroi]